VTLGAGDLAGTGVLSARDFAAGEPITIDARPETARELDTFLEV